MQRGNKKKKKEKERTESKKVDVEVLKTKAMLSMEKQRSMIVEIRRYLDDFNGDLSEIAREPFCIIAFNTLCKTDEKVCLPAEVGLIEYSIKEGVIDQYHEFIDPGKIPEGFKFTCIEESRGSHGIPVQNFSLANSDYKNIFNELKSRIVNKFGGISRYRVYTMSEDLETAEMCLDWIREKSNCWFEAEFEVFDIVYLLVELREIAQFITKQNVAILPAIAKAFLTKYTYDYESNIGCEWHDEEDRTKFCSLGVVKRFAYLLSDHLCEIFKVEFIPEKHLPVRSDHFTYRPMDDYRLDRSIKVPVVEPSPVRRTAVNVDYCITKGRSVFADYEDISVDGFVTDTGLSSQLQSRPVFEHSKKKESSLLSRNNVEDKESFSSTTADLERFNLDDSNQRFNSTPAIERYLLDNDDRCTEPVSTLRRYNSDDSDRCTKSTSALIESAWQDDEPDSEDKDRFIKSTSALTGSLWQEEINLQEKGPFQRLNAAAGGDRGIDDERSLRSLDSPSFLGFGVTASNFERSPPKSQRIPFSSTNLDRNIFEIDKLVSYGRCQRRIPRDKNRT